MTPTVRALSLVAAAAFSFVGCSPVLQPSQAGLEDGRLDPKLAQATWIEEGTQVVLIVSTRAARYRLKQPFFPVEVAVVNRGLEGITLTRESFTLADSRGNRYPMAGREELREGYGGSTDVDRRNFTEATPIVLGKFQSYSYVGSNFTPGFDNSIAVDRIALPRYSYILDFVYFPTPPGFVQGEPLELLLSAPELEDPVFVRFTVQ
jgi:hypothetical protein